MKSLLKSQQCFLQKRKNHPKFHTESKGTMNSQKSPGQGNKFGRLKFPDFKTYYKAIVIKTVWSWHMDRHTAQYKNSESKNKPIHLWSNWFSTRVPTSFNRERTVFSTNDVEITGYPHAKKKKTERSWTLISHDIKKLTWNKSKSQI